MVVIIALVIIAAFVGAAVIGRAAGQTGSPPTISAPPKDPTGGNSCESACSEWDNARQQSCNAQRDEAGARSRADGVRGQVAAATATAVSLGTAAAVAFAAAAAAAGTIFGLPAAAVLTGIAIGLAAAAAAALLTVVAFTAALTAAEDDLLAKTRVRQGWDAEVARLRALINTQCPPEKANACLSRPNPC